MGPPVDAHGNMQYAVHPNPDRMGPPDPSMMGPLDQSFVGPPSDPNLMIHPDPSMMVPHEQHTMAPHDSSVMGLPDPRSMMPSESNIDGSQAPDMRVQPQSHTVEPSRDAGYDVSHENDPGFKFARFGVGGPGMPGHPPVPLPPLSRKKKSKLKIKINQGQIAVDENKKDIATEESPKISEEVIRKQTSAEETVPKSNEKVVEPATDSERPGVSVSEVSTSEISSSEIVEEKKKEDKLEITGNVTAADSQTETAVDSQSSQIAETVKEDKQEVETLQPSIADMSEAAATPPLSTGEISDSSDSTVTGRPMKVKSRWQRASEAEKVPPDTPPPPPPPARKSKDVKIEQSDTKSEDPPKMDKEEGPVPITFDLIDENVYLCERKRSKQMREVRRMVCDCSTSKEDREMGIAGCGEDCLNRMLFIECGSRCACGEYCTNKRFQKKQYSNVAPFRTDWKGYGLQALEDLEPGQFVMEYVGEVLDFRLFKSRTKQYSKSGQQHFYFMAINPEEIIDATTMGNISRFINHSCDPNCETQKWTVNGVLRVGFFVRKPIKKGEEITFDYQFEVYGKEAQKCYCGTEICRGFLGGTKRIQLQSNKKSAAELEEEESERKKKELFEDRDTLEEEIERMSELEEGLRNKEDVLNLCRLMVRAEDPEHRIQILKCLENTTENACSDYL